MKVAWVAPTRRICGIADYSEGLLPALGEELRRRGHSLSVVSLDEVSGSRQAATALAALGPDVVHFQHEYGLYGGKRPPGYSFPRLLRRVTRALPRAALAATAHTVLPPDFRYPVDWQRPGAALRWAANRVLLRRLRRHWGASTWGPLRGVVVHSELQVAWIAASAPAARIAAVPHWVPAAEPVPFRRTPDRRTLAVFGFLSPEKGQDVAVDAMAHLPPSCDLLIAGGARTSAEAPFARRLAARIRDLGLGARCRITGWIPPGEIRAVLSAADAAIAPFRETTGSGSITHSLGRGLPVVASDHPLNVDLAGRCPGAIELFRRGDPEDLAAAVLRVFGPDDARARMRARALEYAGAHTPVRTAAAYADFLESL